MRGYVRCTAGLALGLLTVALVGTTGAADDAPKVPEEVVKGVSKIADALDKNKMSDVSKDAAELKKYDIKLSMRLLKLRASGGFGVGDKGGDAKSDGIERKLEKLSDGVDKDALTKDGAALKQMGERLAAIAVVAESKAPAKDNGKKKVKDWMKWSADMKAAGLDLADAVAAKDPEKVKKAAAAAGKTCTACHDVFRDDE